MSELQLTTRFAIHDGQLDAFQDLVARAVEVTRTRDTGTLQYDWFLSADGAEAVLRERYRDSAAVLEHAGNLGALVLEFLVLSDPAVEIYGEPAPELLAALAPLGPAVYAPFRSS